MSNILLFNDERAGLKALMDWLAAEGFETVMADSSEQALAMMGNQSSLIVMNMKMPGLRGLELLKAARARMANPVVMVVTTPEPAESPNSRIAGSPVGTMPREAPDEVRFGGSLKQLEREAIRRALQTYHGKRKETAKQLGISVRTLQRKILEYQLEPGRGDTNRMMQNNQLH